MMRRPILYRESFGSEHLPDALKTRDDEAEQTHMRPYRAAFDALVPDRYRSK